MNIYQTANFEEIVALKAISGVSPEEGKRLAWLAMQVPAGGIIVEVGSCQGRSAAYMASAVRETSPLTPPLKGRGKEPSPLTPGPSPKGRGEGPHPTFPVNGEEKPRVMIFCVDLWDLGAGITPERHHSPGSFNRFKRNLKTIGVWEMIKPVKAFSTEAAMKFRKLDRKIDLLFIDGGHDYRSVKADILAWKDFVKRDGMIVFHDYSSIPDVMRAVDEEIRRPRWGGFEIYERLFSARRMA